MLNYTRFYMTEVINRVTQQLIRWIFICIIRNFVFMIENKLNKIAAHVQLVLLKEVNENLCNDS